MKALYSTLILSCALFASCTNDELVENQNQGQEVKVTASLNSARTSYTNDGKTVKTIWDAADAIGITTGSQNNLKYTADKSASTTSFTAAETALQGDDGTVAYAYYPYTDKSEGMTVTPYSNYTQSYWRDFKCGSSNSWQSLDFVYAEGTVKESALALNGFKHLFAIVQLTIPLDLIPVGTDGFHTLKISSTAGISIYDDARFNLETKELTGNKYSDIYFYIHPSNVDAGATKVVCYIPLLPIGGNECISFIDNGTGKLIFSRYTPAGGFEAGKVYPIDLSGLTELEGAYTYTHSNGAGTTFLKKNPDGSYSMSPLPGREGDAHKFSARLEYDEAAQTLTMKAGQTLQYWNPYGYIYLLLSAENRSNWTSWHEVTYAATVEKDDEGGIKLAFKDGGTWNDATVRGFSYALYWNSGFSSYGDYYDLVLTKQ